MHPKVDARYVVRMEDVLDLYAEQLDPQDPWCASTRARRNCLAKRVSRSRPQRGGRAVRLRVSPQWHRQFVCRFSTPTTLGAGPGSPIVAPLPTSPTACATSSMSTFHGPSLSASSWITLDAHRGRAYAPSRRPRRTACSGASSSTTRPSTPAGSTWLRSRSACSEANAWTAGSRAANGSSPRSRPGRQRNQRGARINWMFTTDKARAKLARAYPDPSQRVKTSVTR